MRKNIKEKELRKKTLVNQVYAQPVMFIGTDDQELNTKPENMAQPFAVKEHFNTQKKKITNKFKDSDLIFNSNMSPEHMKSDGGLKVPPNI